MFLVRDARAVVASNLRELRLHEVAERRVRMFAMNVNLAVTLALSILVFLRHPRSRRLFLRHEQFIEDPEKALRAILRMTGSNAGLPDLGELRVGAPIEGNRLVRTETIALQRRPADEQAGPVSTAILQAPFEPLLSRLRPAVVDVTATESR